MLPLGFACFLVFGVVLVLAGANQADLARQLGLDLARSGLLGSALALGIGIGVVGVGPLFDRGPRRWLLAGSLLLTGLALLGVDASVGFAGALALLLLIGIGAGAYDTILNAAVAERFGERSARPMTILHAAATIGAMLGPPLAAWLAARRDWSASFHWTGAAHLLLAAAALAVRLPEREPPPAERADASAVGLSRALLPFALVAFAYVGVESSMTIFAVPYATGAFALGEPRGQLAISTFWFGLLAGRLAALALRGALDARVLLAAGALGCAALAAGVGLGIRQVEATFAVVGFALGSVYPVAIALAAQQSERARGTAAGLAAGAGALGGFAVPWLTGALGDRLGIAAAMGSLALWSLAIALAAAGAARRRP